MPPTEGFDRLSMPLLLAAVLVTGLMLAFESNPPALRIGGGIELAAIGFSTAIFSREALLQASLGAQGATVIVIAVLTSVAAVMAPVYAPELRIPSDMELWLSAGGVAVVVLPRLLAREVRRRRLDAGAGSRASGRSTS